MKYFTKCMIAVAFLLTALLEDTKAQVDVTVNPIGLLFGNLGVSG